jgi:GAF domain-containing protein
MTSIRQEEQIVSTLAELGGVLTSQSSLAGSLEKITELAAALVPGADHVGTSLADGGPIQTKGSTDRVAHLVDEIQHELGEGPCIESLEQDEVFRVDDLDRDERWPRFAAAVRERTPVRSILAVVIPLEGQAMGALNLYADEVNAFEDDDHAIAAIFATEAALVLAATRQRISDAAMIENLRNALQSRDVIGQAKGILMMRETCTDEEAFAMLSAASQKLNLKLKEIAQLVIDDIESHR